MLKDYILARTARIFTSHVTLACGKSEAVDLTGNLREPEGQPPGSFLCDAAGSSDNSVDLRRLGHRRLGKRLEIFRSRNRSRKLKEICSVGLKGSRPFFQLCIFRPFLKRGALCRRRGLSGPAPSGGGSRGSAPPCSLLSPGEQNEILHARRRTALHVAVRR